MNEHVALKPDEVGYDSDFYEWTRRQADLLRAGRLDLVDIDNIAEEIESLGKRDRRGIESQLVRLIAHLLKLQVSDDRQPRGGWKETVLDARLQIELALRDSPSLRRIVPDLCARQWRHGLQAAVAGLTRAEERARAASLPPFSDLQMLDPDFFPGD